MYERPTEEGEAGFGVGMMTVALWGAYMLLLQYRETQRSTPSTM